MYGAERRRRLVRHEAYYAEYKRTNDALAPLTTDTPELKAAEAALKTAVQTDLKRPVMSRDVAFSATGPCEIGDEEESGEVIAKRFHAAGYAMPVDLMDDVEAWSELLGLIDALGDGSVGVRRAVELLKGNEAAGGA